MHEGPKGSLSSLDGLHIVHMGPHDLNNLRFHVLKHRVSFIL